VWVTDLSKIWVYTNGAGTPAEWTPPSFTAQTQPVAAAVFANGDVVVVLGATPTADVQKFNATGHFLGSFGSSWSSPNGVTISPAGDVYVADNGIQTDRGVYFFPGGSPTACKPFVGDDPYCNPTANPPGILWSPMSNNLPYSQGRPSNAWNVGVSDSPIHPWVSANGDLFIGDGANVCASRVLRNGTNGYDNYFTVLVDAYDYTQPTTNRPCLATSAVTRFGC
jgi:hypothetical protein